MKIVFSQRYDISFFGIERLHPFDSKKYGRAWHTLCDEFGISRLKNILVPVDRAVSTEELQLVHSIEYLDSLRSSKVLAAALEIPLLQLLPPPVVLWRVITPMRWATRGSVLAAKAALVSEFAVNLSGGYHHAKPANGEGFCIISDIALIVRQLTNEGLLQTEDSIAYIDLDAHQGNGVCHQFLSEKRVKIFDMYNRATYPRYDYEARQRIDCDIALPAWASGSEYAEQLEKQLPEFLDRISSSRKPALAIYNAGTDVFIHDRLGGLSLYPSDVLRRDLFVIEEFRRRKIPTVMLLSGGYSPQSYKLVAETLRKLIRDFAV